MNHTEPPSSENATLRLFISWTVVGIPLIWGIWETVIKLPDLFR